MYLLWQGFHLAGNQQTNFTAERWLISPSLESVPLEQEEIPRRDTIRVIPALQLMNGL